MTATVSQPLPLPLPEGTPTPANYLFAACQRCGIAIHDKQAEHTLDQFERMLCEDCARLLEEGEVAMGGVL